MIKESALELIGNTPMVYLNRLARDCPATLTAKLEMFNPISVKDRTVLSMIESAEARGEIDQDTVIVEATSGNTGMALAYICAIKGYRLIICMSEAMSEERKMVLRAFGAELHLTPPGRHTLAAKEEAMRIAASIENSFYVNQHGNPANIEAHARTTSEEIWADTEGLVDVVVCALGTTGTAIGIAQTLKQKNPAIQVIGVEPSTAPMLSEGRWAPHKMPGTSPGFVPDLYRDDVLDDIMLIEPETEAYAMCRRVAREEGLLLGVSSGGTIAAALEIAGRPENEGKLITAICADSGQRYLSVEGLFSNTE